MLNGLIQESFCVDSRPVRDIETKSPQSLGFICRPLQYHVKSNQLMPDPGAADLSCYAGSRSADSDKDRDLAAGQKRSLVPSVISTASLAARYETVKFVIG